MKRSRPRLTSPTPFAHGLRQRVQGYVTDIPAGCVEYRGEFPACALPNPPTFLLRQPESEEYLSLFLKAEDR